MKLDECLPALPACYFSSVPTIEAYGLACARAGALAALDEALLMPIPERIRRLRDTIAKGES